MKCHQNKPAIMQSKAETAEEHISQIPKIGVNHSACSGKLFLKICPMVLKRK